MEIFKRGLTEEETSEINEQLELFRKRFPATTSGDWQTFILAYHSALEARDWKEIKFANPEKTSLSEIDFIFDTDILIKFKSSNESEQIAIGQFIKSSFIGFLIYQPKNYYVYIRDENTPDVDLEDVIAWKKI